MTAASFALVGLCAFLIATMASLAGYGAGLMMPLVLVPLIGAQAVVPVLSVSALFNNGSRIAAFRGYVNWKVATRFILTSVPACLLGASFYASLNASQAALLIGSVLLVIVPGRRFMNRLCLAERPVVVLVGGVIYGVLIGMAPGAGIVLITVLMAMGLSGRAVIATDAVISLIVGIAKVSTFQALGAMTADLWIIALVIGIAGVPGAFVARWLMERMHTKLHEAILDAAVLIGGTTLILRGFSIL